MLDATGPELLVTQGRGWGGVGRLLFVSFARVERDTHWAHDLRYWWMGGRRLSLNVRSSLPFWMILYRQKEVELWRFVETRKPRDLPCISPPHWKSTQRSSLTTLLSSVYPSSKLGDTHNHMTSMSRVRKRDIEPIADSRRGTRSRGPTSTSASPSIPPLEKVEMRLPTLSRKKSEVKSEAGAWNNDLKKLKSSWKRGVIEGYGGLTASINGTFTAWLMAEGRFQVRWWGAFDSFQGPVRGHWWEIILIYTWNGFWW